MVISLVLVPEYKIRLDIIVGWQDTHTGSLPYKVRGITEGKYKRNTCFAAARQDSK